jgi:hypothetical protein
VTNGIYLSLIFSNLNFYNIWFKMFAELMDYLKTAISTEKQNGSLLRFSAHLALFFRSASIQLKVF